MVGGINLGDYINEVVNKGFSKNNIAKGSQKYFLSDIYISQKNQMVGEY